MDTISLAAYERTQVVAEKANITKSALESNVTCSNHDSHNHLFEKCWKKGSGAEDKAPTWYKEA